MTEFDLIARIAARAGRRDDVALGIGDDAALLIPPPGQQLVVSCDTLNVGVHFSIHDKPADIGWKALAVNLSDLAAMGAVPAWVLLSLSLPKADEAFVDGFFDGFLQLADESGVALVGGDTTSGPLSICVTALGWVPTGMALTRATAQVGDAVVVSGTLGDAAAALHLMGIPTHPVNSAARELRDRLHRPVPRLSLAQALRTRAHAVIDISDGLLADLGHIAQASGVGMVLEADALPCSGALAALFDKQTRLRWQATGGEDYELAFTLPPARLGELRIALDEHDLPLTCIGRVVEGSGVNLYDGQNEPVQFEQTGWDHFIGAAR